MRNLTMASAVELVQVDNRSATQLRFPPRRNAMTIKKNVLIASVATAGIAMAGAASAQDMYKSGVGGLYAGAD